MFNNIIVMYYHYIFKSHENEMNKDEKIKELKKNIEFQSKIIKKFGDELQYFQSQKGNIRFEIKLKKYRDEIIELKNHKHKCIVSWTRFKEIVKEKGFLNTLDKVIK